MQLDCFIAFWEHEYTFSLTKNEFTQSELNTDFSAKAQSQQSRVKAFNVFLECEPLWNATSFHTNQSFEPDIPAPQVPLTSTYSSSVSSTLLCEINAIESR